MNTNTLTLPLSESLSAFVQEEAASQGYATPTDYIAEMLKSAQKKKMMQKLEALLLEGLDSGPAMPMTAEDWVEIRRRTQEQLAGEQSQ